MFGFNKIPGHSTPGASASPRTAPVQGTAPKIVPGMLEAARDVPAWLATDCFNRMKTYGSFLPEGANRISLQVKRVDPPEERKAASATAVGMVYKTTEGTTQIGKDANGEYKATVTLHIPHDADPADTDLRAKTDQVFIHELIGHVAMQMQALVRTGQMIPGHIQHADMVKADCAYHKAIKLALATLPPERRASFIQHYLRDVKTMVLQDAPADLNAAHPESERILAALDWVEKLTEKSKDLTDPFWQYQPRSRFPMAARERNYSTQARKTDAADAEG